MHGAINVQKSMPKTNQQHFATRAQAENSVGNPMGVVECIPGARDSGNGIRATLPTIGQL